MVDDDRQTSNPIERSLIEVRAAEPGGEHEGQTSEFMPRGAQVELEGMGRAPQPVVGGFTAPLFPSCCAAGAASSLRQEEAGEEDLRGNLAGRVIVAGGSPAMIVGRIAAPIWMYMLDAS